MRTCYTVTYTSDACRSVINQLYLFPRPDIWMTDVAMATHAGLLALVDAETMSERAAQL